MRLLPRTVGAGLPGRPSVRPVLLPGLVLGLVLGLLMVVPPPSPVAAGATSAALDGQVDEVHYSLGPDGTSIVLHWRGAATTLQFGAGTGYGRTAAGVAPATRPVDDPGPFREVRLGGLLPGRTYHYRIGSSGPDRWLRTSPPTGAPVHWVDVGDTASTRCKPWMSGTHDLIARQLPWFVTHGGDISYANDCGPAAVHALYNDIQTWSRSAAFMPAWGNHEYAAPTAAAPAGTPRDSLANYKGRSAIPSPQRVPTDTPQRTRAPGCSGGGGRNSCQGEDWGWFRAGNVLLISYPEPWDAGTLAAWQAVAQPIMAAAQLDPRVHAIVTYGHRPPISSTPLASPAVGSAIAGLADRFSPRPAGAASTCST
jgi:hypothetical protein